MTDYSKKFLPFHCRSASSPFPSSNTFPSCSGTLHFHPSLKILAYIICLHTSTSDNSNKLLPFHYRSVSFPFPSTNTLPSSSGASHFDSSLKTTTLYCLLSISIKYLHTSMTDNSNQLIPFHYRSVSFRSSFHVSSQHITRSY